jgi:hypothetical protein|tara:strand:- start:785 stop:1585 length:801 start_codon:yes stop_codon:yes gene_type:complete
MMSKLLSLIIITSILFSCKDDEKEVYTRSAKDHSLAEVITMKAFKEVLTITPTFIIDKKYAVDTNIIITAKPLLSDSIFPKEITIDYGMGITGPDGKTRQGKIKVTINSGTVLTENLQIVFEEYVSEGTEVYGAINFDYSNDNSTISYAVSIAESGLTFKSANGTMKWFGDFNIHKADGGNTPNINDDIFKLSGTTNGVDISVTSYTVSTQTDHTIDFNCKSIITAGTSKITPNGKDEHTVDYGNGDCNANAIISLSTGNSQNFNF